MPFLILVFLFILVPVVEISFLIRVGESIGGFNTILMVIATAVLGVYLVRQQGFETLKKVQTQTNQGKMPAMEMAEGIILLLSGIVLLLPGLLTDILGFTMLIPPIRRGVVAWFVKRSIVNAATQGQNGFGAQFGGQVFRDASNPQQESNSSGNIIEGEVIEPKEK